MGTRNLTIVALDGKYKVSKYCQWDGYPDGQGITALHFVRDEMRRNVFEKRLRELHYLTDQQIADLWDATVGPGNHGFVTMEQSEKMKVEYPQFQRDMGATVLLEVQNGMVIELEEPSVDFAADSLFCEWAYVVDLDKNTFEVYSGFSKEPLTERDRFFELKDKKRSEYEPIKVKAQWSLDKLPTDEEFFNALKDPEELEHVPTEKLTPQVRLGDKNN